jgi:hypothetical protein
VAEIVTIEGQQYKKRSPWGIWGLIFLTLSIYGFVWYYKINDEARRFLKDEQIKPVLALLALFVPIVNLVSYYRTGERIVRMEERVGIQKTVEPILGVVAGIFYFLHMPYYQGHLNKVWDEARSGAALPPSGTPAIPPPPPQAPQVPQEPQAPQAQQPPETTG